jgi:outer membrane immunogenic protein
MRITTKLVLSTAAASLGLTTIASAADLPLPERTYTKAPAYVAPVYDWTGFYIGGNVGYGWGRSNSTLALSDPGTGSTLNSAASKFNMDGVIGGGQIGYNWQSGRWVFGLETDFQGANQKGGMSALCAGGSLAVPNSACATGGVDDARNVTPAFPVASNLSESLDWFGTVRGRIGPTVTPTVLAYVTGGLAYGDVRTSSTVSGSNVVGANGGTTTVTPFANAFSQSTVKTGWTVGVGLEGVISGNWTAKIEYLYIDLGTVSGSFGTSLTAPSGALATSSYSSHITDNILRVGVNYRFGGPVVAKY